MKLIYRMLGVFLILSCILYSSCTDEYSDINTNKSSISEVGPEGIPLLFAGALRWNRQNEQVGQNLYADQYAQYFCYNVTYFTSDRYAMVDEWLMEDPWEPMYTKVSSSLNEIINNTDPNSAENAIANIWWVQSFHRLTDYWGPIPYFYIGEISSDILYTPQDSIYYDFFNRLNAAVKVLKENTDQVPFGVHDIVFQGDINKWIKFANTLRLRLAIRISNIEPERARTEGEAAYRDGLMVNSPADDALIENGETWMTSNRLSRYSEWDEVRMTATMESILKGYNDPRISEYFLPAKKTGTYEGIRNGLPATKLSLGANRANALSHWGPRWSAPSRGGIESFYETKGIVMTTAEAYFLRAEGAILGWDMGASAKECYENGILNSMYQWGITDVATINAYVNGTSLPIAPDDYLKSPAVSDVPVQFDTSDKNVQLEQISIQKWLALYPDGKEAWADNRRSRHFKMYPVVSSDNPEIPDPSVEHIRRVHFIVAEKLANPLGVESGIMHLKNGEDKINTPLWWDVH